MVATCEIINIGNELLIGKIVNSNASWLSNKITYLGYNVSRITVVSDNICEIANSIQEAQSRHPHVIIITGGLGPTFDDITLEGLAKALNVSTKLNQKALNMIKKKYVTLGLNMTKERTKMAKFPENADALQNPVGTAPGCLIKSNGVLIIALPGVPQEMKEIFESLTPKFKKTSGKNFFDETSFDVTGISESELAPFVKNIMEKYDLIYIKSHPQKTKHGSKLEIHITGFGNSDQKLRKQISSASFQLKEYILSINGIIT